ncbi:MAG: hypothetical protein IPI67_25660 [Myxococcales bacterium]|nr:hypothetical protein [Myxococcales bacterium]
MNPGNSWVLGVSLAAALAAGVGVQGSVADVGARVSAALLVGLAVLMLGGWVAARNHATDR